ncbi:MAG TPA: hypothetical protein VF178_16365 [Gemmatimonadaceae bacterium]|jgi:hypothetical protein
MAEESRIPKANSSGNAEDNDAQRQSDATPDAVGEGGGEAFEDSDRAGGRGSTANGVSAFDEDEGKERRKLYKEGATLVSRTD